MKLEKLTPLLRTNRLSETIDWYVSILGFIRIEFSEEAAYALVRSGTIDVILAGPNAHLPFETPSFTGSLYFHTPDINGCWEKLRDKCEVCYEPEIFEYGMHEFAVYDINGYLLQFGQVMDSDELK